MHVETVSVYLPGLHPVEVCRNRRTKKKGTSCIGSRTRTHFKTQHWRPCNTLFTNVMRLHQTNTQTCVISWSGLRSASSDPTSLHKLVSSSLCGSQSHQSRKCLRNVISKSAGLLLMRSFEHTPGCARWSHRWHLYKSVRVQCIGLGGLKKKKKKKDYIFHSLHSALM